VSLLQLPEHDLRRFGELSKEPPEGPSALAQGLGDIPPVLGRVTSGFTGLIALGVMTPAEATALLAEVLNTVTRHLQGGQDA
jgi:hypothetical protein